MHMKAELTCARLSHLMVLLFEGLCKYVYS